MRTQHSNIILHRKTAKNLKFLNILHSFACACVLYSNSLITHDMRFHCSKYIFLQTLKKKICRWYTQLISSNISKSCETQQKCLILIIVLNYFKLYIIQFGCRFIFTRDIDHDLFNLVWFVIYICVAHSGNGSCI